MSDFDSRDALIAVCLLLVVVFAALAGVWLALELVK